MPPAKHLHWGFCDPGWWRCWSQSGPALPPKWVRHCQFLRKIKVVPHYTVDEGTLLEEHCKLTYSGTWSGGHKGTPAYTHPPMCPCAHTLPAEQSDKSTSLRFVRDFLVLISSSFGTWPTAVLYIGQIINYKGKLISYACSHL